MIAPGDEDEERVDDPDAVFLQETWHRTIVADKFLDQVVDRGERTDGAPEASQEQEDDRDERPPQHPGQGGAEVVVRGFGSEQQLEHDDHEDQQRGPLDDAREPFTAHEPVNRFDLQEVAACKNTFILGFEFGGHVIVAPFTGMDCFFRMPAEVIKHNIDRNKTPQHDCFGDAPRECQQQNQPGAFRH